MMRPKTHPSTSRRRDSRQPPKSHPFPLLQSNGGHVRLLLSSMKCPFCGFENDKVVDSRESKEGESIRRRRECLKCEKRFTTYERIDEIPYMVVKKDGRREKFERQKVLNGLLRACEKRPSRWASWSRSSTTLKGLSSTPPIASARPAKSAS